VHKADNGCHKTCEPQTFGTLRAYPGLKQELLYLQIYLLLLGSDSVCKELVTILMPCCFTLTALMLLIKVGNSSSFTETLNSTKNYWMCFNIVGTVHREWN